MIKMAGIILVVLGILALVYQGFTYTETKKDAQIGPLVIQHDETKTIPFTPIVGGVFIAAGVAALALFMGDRRKT
jgi:uncharacterized membrane protein HdeD (DUF308 family)